MTDQKHPDTNGNSEKTVLSFQVPQEYLDSMNEFRTTLGYQTLSNAVKVHLRVAAHIWETSPKEFLEIVAKSKDVLQSA